MPVKRAFWIMAVALVTIATKPAICVPPDKFHDLDLRPTDPNEIEGFHSQDAKGYNLRGMEWFKRGEYGKAIADYNVALRIKPKFAFAYCNRGQAWNYRKNYDKALAEDLQEALTQFSLIAGELRE